MEEILASIRKIISEDSTEQQPAAEAKPEPVAEPVAEPEADILDLTQEVAPEPPPPPPAPAPAPVAAEPEQDVVFQPIVEPAPVAAPVATGVHHDIFSDKTRQSIDDAFAAIDHEDEETAPVRAVEPVSLPATATGATVEAVFERAVRTSFVPVTKEWLGENADEIVAKMKPLIREWMDEHFPALLEMAVREEVARVAKARASKR
jgi:cell pole-organizing protein PopZ